MKVTMKGVLPMVGAMMSVMIGKTLAQEASSSTATTTKTLEMIVTAHPLATAAGEKILQAGGTAADAFVAAQAVLGLVEPQSSGLGGGAFAVYYDAPTGETTTLDGREKAPDAATEDRFLQFNSFLDAWQSGLSVGVPGAPLLMEALHDRFGRLEWSTLFADAKQLAEKGFELSARTEASLNSLLDLNAQLGFNCTTRFFFRDPTAYDYFIDPDTCRSKPAGTILTNAKYAATIDTLISAGADGFYSGEIAEAIVQGVQNDAAVAGDMTITDLANYEVIERDPVCIKYRGKNVCGMGPPSSGALAVGQILGILENFDIAQIDDPMNIQAVHLFSQAGRLAFADRSKYVGDTDFVDVPLEGMLDSTYLKSRAELINEDGTDMGLASPGSPPTSDDTMGADRRTKVTGTSHVSIIDRCGNVLSATSSIEAPFGNGVMVKGFLLNNELTDFSVAPVDADGNPVANRVQPNKRPRSSMSPTIVFDENGMPELVTGSPGGARIIGYTAQSIYNVYDFGLDPGAAVKVPHYQNNNAATDLEPPIPGVTDTYNITELTAELEARNHTVSQIAMASGLGIIQRVGDVFLGGADKRREGTVGGTNSTDDVDTSYCQATSGASTLGFPASRMMFVFVGSLLGLFWHLS